MSDAEDIDAMVDRVGLSRVVGRLRARFGEDLDGLLVARLGYRTLRDWDSDPDVDEGKR